MAGFSYENMENANMKTLLSTVAVVALLAAAPAFAADNATPADQAPAATDQNKTDMMKKAPAAAEAPAAATDQNKAAQAPAATDQNKPAEAAQAPAASDQNKAATASAGSPKFITQQTDQERLASKWIGQPLSNQANESVGSVSDLVIGQNGQIDAVVVGVGGFLGIGEKMVAIPFSAVQAATDSDGNTKLVVQLSKDELNKAPEFLTLADLKAKADAAKAPAGPAAPSPAPAQ
jgi:sporulation protein YlmC with PRC-barrel domain